MIVMSGNLE